MYTHTPAYRYYSIIAVSLKGKIKIFPGFTAAFKTAVQSAPPKTASPYFLYSRLLRSAAGSRKAGTAGRKHGALRQMPYCHKHLLPTKACAALRLLHAPLSFRLRCTTAKARNPKHSENRRKPCKDRMLFQRLPAASFALLKRICLSAKDYKRFLTACSIPLKNTSLLLKNSTKSDKLLQALLEKPFDDGSGKLPDPQEQTP